MNGISARIIKFHAIAACQQGFHPYAVVSHAIAALTTSAIGPVKERRFAFSEMT
jgi:hypothetical protein